MPTISAHFPEKTYKRLRARIGRRQSASTFIREAVEEKLDAKRIHGMTPEMRRIAQAIQELIEDAQDLRDAEEIMARVKRGESKLYKWDDVRHELGI